MLSNSYIIDMDITVSCKTFENVLVLFHTFNDTLHFLQDTNLYFQIS